MMRGIEHGTDACGHGAAHQCSALERNGGIDFDHVFDRHRRIFGHHTAAGENVESNALHIVGAQSAVGQARERLALIEAQHRAPLGAEAAFAAHIDEGGNDMIAGSQRVDAVAHLDDFPRRFVPEYER